MQPFEHELQAFHDHPILPRNSRGEEDAAVLKLQLVAVVLMLKSASVACQPTPDASPERTWFELVKNHFRRLHNLLHAAGQLSHIRCLPTVSLLELAEQ